MTPLFIATHLLAFVAGGVTVRWFMVRHLRVREFEPGHVALEVNPDPTPGGTVSPYRAAMRRHTYVIVLIVAALVVIGIGIQAHLAAEDNDQRDARDRAYADCLTNFAADLVATIETRTNAGSRLERAERRLEAAERRKQATLDRLLTITMLARDVPPRATVAQFDKALEARVRAQERYATVYAQVEQVRAATEQVRAANQYVKPQVVCDR